MQDLCEIWFRGPLADTVRTALLSELMADSGFFDVKTIAGLLDRHASGRSDHSVPIWSLLMFQRFLQDVHTGTDSEKIQPMALQRA